MSDTDKTRPEWVQINDPYNKGWLEEVHHCSGKVCDIESYDARIGWRSSKCHIFPTRKAIKKGVYPRRKGVQYYTYNEVRHERAQWRAVRDKILSGDIDAAEKSPRGVYSHRHSAIWLAW